MSTAIATKNTTTKQDIENGVVFYLQQSSPSIALKLVMDANLEPIDAIDLYQFITDWLVDEEDLHKRTYSNAYTYYSQLIPWLVKNESLNAKLYVNMFRCLDKNFICKHISEILYDFIEEDRYDDCDLLLSSVFTGAERLKILEDFWSYLIDINYQYQKHTVSSFLIPKMDELLPRNVIPVVDSNKYAPKDWNEMFIWCDKIKDLSKQELYKTRIIGLFLQSDEVLTINRYLEEDHGKEYRKKIDDFFTQMTSLYYTEASVLFTKNLFGEPLRAEFLRFLKTRNAHE